MCEKYYHTQAGLWRWSLYIDVPWEENRKQPYHVGVCFSWLGGEKGHEDELELVLLRVGELQYLCILGRSTGGIVRAGPGSAHCSDSSLQSLLETQPSSMHLVPQSPSQNTVWEQEERILPYSKVSTTARRQIQLILTDQTHLRARPEVMISSG